MVSSINAVNTTQSVIRNNADDVKTLIKYVNSEALKDTPDTFVSSAKSSIGSAALFEGIPLLRFLKKNAYLKKAGEHSTKSFAASEAMEQIGNINKDALKNLLKGEGKLKDRILSFMTTSKESVNAFKDVKGAAAAQAKEAKAIKKGVKDVTKLADKASAKVKTAQEAINNLGNKTAAEAGTKAAGKLGKAGKLLKSSGAGFMLVFSGITELFTEVVPTFKELGSEKGVKQLGKSAVKVVGDTAGFIAGDCAGTALGTAIGTAICPGIGTAVGAVCGFVGGMLGSFVAGKVTNAITGKSEREKAKEEQLNQQSEAISNDSATMDELKEAAKLKLNEEAQYGELSEDAQIALESLNNIENPFAA